MEITRYSNEKVCSLQSTFYLQSAVCSPQSDWSSVHIFEQLNFIFKSVDLGPLEVILPKHLQLMRIYPYFNLHHLKLQQSNC